MTSFAGRADKKLEFARRQYRDCGPSQELITAAMEAAEIYEYVGEASRAKLAIDLAVDVERALGKKSIS